TADEFLYYGSSWHILEIGDGQKVIYEPQKPFRFYELGYRIVYLDKERFCETLKDTQLVSQCGVEHSIGLFLEGKNVPVLAPSDTRPHPYRIQSRMSPEPVVSDYSAQ